MHRATLTDAKVIIHPLSVSTCVSNTPLWSACVSNTPLWSACVSSAPCQSAAGVSNTPSMETRADETAMHRATLADAKVIMSCERIHKKTLRGLKVLCLYEREGGFLP
jgi:hypothetical protein